MPASNIEFSEEEPKRDDLQEVPIVCSWNLQVYKHANKPARSYAPIHTPIHSLTRPPAHPPTRPYPHPQAAQAHTPRAPTHSAHTHKQLLAELACDRQLHSAAAAASADAVGAREQVVPPPLPLPLLPPPFPPSCLPPSPPPS